MRSRITCFVAVVLAAISIEGAASAYPPALLELKTSDTTYQGRLAALGEEFCWLMDRDGRLERVNLDRVEEHVAVESRFRPYSAADIRERLRREFGNGYEVAGTQHYVVCAAPGKASQYAQILEAVYRGFHGYFSTRGFAISKPEFPLVAVVFPDRVSFDRYCREDGIRDVPGLLGYYLPQSNRVALFETDGVAEVLVHEATHQVAFNAGLHSRIGENPKWVVEGLATVFEAAGILNGSSQASQKTRINRERFVRFENFAAERREPKSLAAFIGSDAMFASDSLDAYSQAWALSFYLIETRPSQYARYLKLVAERDPLDAYDSDQRVADFQKVFGSDLVWLEADFLRFMKRIE